MKSVNNYKIIRGIRNCWGCDNKHYPHGKVKCECKHAGRATSKRDAQREIMDQLS